MLPSLSALRAFDAAARAGNFRAAAEQLSVTPTAISHHVRGLEGQLGVRLFERVGRRVILTEEGRRLLEATSQAFSLLEDTVRSMRQPAQHIVRLVAGPIFTARWIMPRISDLWRKHPGVELEVLPTFQPGRLGHRDADIVIRWERISGMSDNATKLLELRAVAIASQSFVARHGPIDEPAQLLELPLLHQRDHWGWLDWFTAMGVSTPTSLRGPVFQDANVLLRGASEGQGAIIGWLPLIEQDLREGRAVRLFDEHIAPTHAYFVSRQAEGPPRRAVRDVMEWLLSQR